MNTAAPSKNALMLARAHVARSLVAEGLLDGETALAMAVWPSQAMLERERRVAPGTIASRAFSRRHNP